MRIKSIVGFIGSLLLVVCVFTPFVEFPLTGNLSYFSYNILSGITLILLAFASGFFIYHEKYKNLLYTSSVSLIVLIYTANKLEPFIMDIHVYWSYFLLFTGTILLFISGLTIESYKLSLNVLRANIDSINTIEFSGYFKDSEGNGITNAMIIIERKIGKNWIKVKNELTDEMGNYSCTYALREKGELSFRARSIVSKVNNRSKFSRLKTITIN